MEQRLAMTTIALAAVLLTSTGVVFVGMAMARGDPCPDPGFCTCENGILHDSKMPDFSLNDNCIECGPASDANPDGICT